MAIIQEPSKIIWMDNGVQMEKDSISYTETTMVYMEDIIKRANYIIQAGADMGNMDLILGATGILDWVYSDISWHSDGEPGDSDNQWWDAAVERMEHHRLLADLTDLETEARKLHKEWTEAGNKTKVFISNISIR